MIRRNHPAWLRGSENSGSATPSTAAQSYEHTGSRRRSYAKLLADLGYLGEATRLTVPTPTPKGSTLTEDAKCANLLHSCVPALAERGNALIKNYKAARHVSLSPEHVGPITAAILVLLHTEHDRTT